jgi:4-amino-4-deoxy-L-arabinose transferase-like glycosyltransferase
VTLKSPVETGREWLKAAEPGRSGLLLAAILAVAAVLRFWALDAGIPYSVGVDEPEILHRAVTMMRTGDYNPHFFDYPGFYIYVQLVTAIARFLAGASAGEWRSLAQVRTEDFYLWGRAVTALFGVATVFLVYRCGLRWGPRHAALAAGLFAVMPMHVRESHYVLTDVPATLFATLALLLTFRAHEGERAMAFAWAGAAAGLGAATKYPVALALILPIVGAWMTPGARPSRLVAALAAIAGAGVAFLIGAPYTILDLPAFLNAYAGLAGYYVARKLAEPAGITYLKHLRNNFAYPAALLVLAGLVLAVVRAVKGPARIGWTLTVIFPVLYFWFVSRQSLVFGRYLLPILPFLCLLGAGAVVGVAGMLRRYEVRRPVRTAVTAGLTVALLLPPALTAIAFDRMISRRGTVDLAYDWIIKNVPRQSRIVVETRAMILPDTYDASNIPQLRRKAFETYREDGVQYLVASSQVYSPYLTLPHQHPTEYDDYMRIFGQAEEVAKFTPSDGVPGPELRILKIPQDDNTKTAREDDAKRVQPPARSGR